MTLTSPAIAVRMEFAASIARRAGRLARELSVAREHLRRSVKAGRELVTDANVAVEALVRSDIQRAFPADEILGEEGGGLVGSITWIIDPIDGTSNFAAGLPYWCHSIALAIEGAVVVAATYDAVHDELFGAVAGEGATCNGAKLRVRPCSSFEGAMIGLGMTAKGNQEKSLMAARQLLDQGASVRILGAGALALAHIAAGLLDGFYEPDIKIWDCAAGRPLVQEAGGWCNHAWSPCAPTDGFSIVAAGSGLRSLEAVVAC